MLNIYRKYLVDYPTKLISYIKIKKSVFVVCTFLIYILAILSAFFEGISLVFITTIFINNEISNTFSHIEILNNFFLKFQHFEFNHSFLILTFTFFLAWIFKWALIFLEGYFTSKLRKKIQIQLFRKYLFSNWDIFKKYRVGNLVNINNNEAVLAARYCISAIMLPTHILICLVFFALALAVNIKMVLYFLIIIIPLILIVRSIVKKQAQLSTFLTNLRNLYTSNITDRINGLMDIYNLKKKSFHFKKGISVQLDYTKAEIKVNLLMSIMQTLNLLIPLISLLIITILSFSFGNDFISLPLYELATIGLLGYKTLSSVNSINIYFGNLARLSGSLSPLFEIFRIKKIKDKKLIKDDIKEITLTDIGYKYENASIINNLNFTFYKGKVNLIIGPSGKGKTTIASLISGLQKPSFGKLIFKLENNKFYPSSEYEFKIGYLTQNVYLFNDTLKDNLILGEQISDKKIWKTLENVNAKTFVKNSGGLLQNVQESGKNFSGGQVRRLGIARMLLLNSKVLLLDEPLSGLDEENKNLFLNLILKLYNDFLIIIITHEEINIKNSIKNVLRI